MTMVITFNDQQSDNINFGIQKIMRVQRPIHSSAISRSIRTPGRRGEWYAGHDRQGTTIPVQFYFKAASFAQKRQFIRNIAAWLETPDGELKYLLFSDEPGVRYRAMQVSEIRADEIAYKGFFEAVFWVPDGYAEAVNETIIALDNGDYEGTVPTGCVITLTAAAGHGLKVTYKQISQYVELDLNSLGDSFAGGETVIINTETHYVTIDGVDARKYVTVESDYFELRPGEFLLTVEGGSIDEIKFREKFL